MERNEQVARTGCEDDSVVTAGIEVRKGLLASEEEVPTVQYEVRSERDDAVDVRIRDELPSGVPPEAVGFHPDYHGSDWRMAEGGVEFRHRLDGGAEIVTVCGVQLPQEIDRNALLGTPTVRVDAPRDASMSPAGENDDQSLDFDGENDDPALDLDEEKTDDDPALDLDEEGDVDAESTGQFEFEESGTSDGTRDAGGTNQAVADRSRTEPAAADRADGRAERSMSGGGSATSGVEASTAAALADELGSERVDEATRETLKRELNLRTSESTSALLEHVQDKITRKREQLRSEVESLESSVERLYAIKADGEAVDELRTTIERLDETAAEIERLEAVETGLNELRDATAKKDRVDRLESGLTELQAATATAAELQQLAARIDQLESTAADADELAELDEHVRTLAAGERVDELEARAEDLATDERVDTVEGAVEELRETAATGEELTTLEHRVDELDEETVGEDRFEDTVDELRSTAATTAEVQTLRDQLDDLEAGKADADRVDGLEATIEDEYVALADVDGTIERRVEKGVRTVFALGIGTGAILLSLVLAATQGPVPAAVAFAAGVLVIGAWWLSAGDGTLR